MAISEGQVEIHILYMYLVVYFEKIYFLQEQLQSHWKLC